MKAWAARRNWWAIGFWAFAIYASIASMADQLTDISRLLQFVISMLTLACFYSFGQLSQERATQLKQQHKEEPEAEDFWNWF